MTKTSANSVAPSKRLLVAGDPSPAIVQNPGGASPWLLIGDHAGRAIPAALGDLGVPPEAMERHIAWDIGVAGLGARLSVLLGAPFVQQAYSRLVIDCNRVDGAADACPAESDDQPIPANVGLSPEAVAQRRAEIHDPYQAAIAAALDARPDARLVSLHSFTPVMRGFARPWRVGVLHRNDSPLSRRALDLLRAELGAMAGDNEPYAMDGIDNTVPLHVDARGIDYLELEVRQDLIADAAGQDEMAAFLARLLNRLD